MLGGLCLKGLLLFLSLHGLLDSLGLFAIFLHLYSRLFPLFGILQPFLALASSFVHLGCQSLCHCWLLSVIIAICLWVCHRMGRYDCLDELLWRWLFLSHRLSITPAVYLGLNFGLVSREIDSAATVLLFLHFYHALRLAFDD